MSRHSLAAFVFACLWMLASQPGHAQALPSGSGPPPGVPRPSAGGLSGPPPTDPAEARYEHKQEAARVSERFKQIQRDTQTLLQLATELQASVDKADKEELSMDVIRKAEQIEKLAKSVKEKMRQQ